MRPFNVDRAFFCRNKNFLSVNDNTLFIKGNRTIKTTLGRVLLKQMSQCFSIGEVIDPHNFQIRLLENEFEYIPSDASETIDSNFNFCHKNGMQKGYFTTNFDEDC